MKLAQQGGGFASWCVKPSGSPVVTVTLPDGETEQFRAKFSPECTAFVPTVYGQLVFEPLDAKTQSTLEQLDFGTIRWANLSDGRSDLIDLSDPDLKPIDPTNYKLTTEDGTVSRPHCPHAIPLSARPDFRWIIAPHGSLLLDRASTHLDFRPCHDQRLPNS